MMTTMLVAVAFWQHIQTKYIASAALLERPEQLQNEIPVIFNENYCRQPREYH